MKPLTATVLLAVLAAATPGSRAAAPVHPAELGELCAASAKAEKAKDFAAAIRSMQVYQKRGGDPFLATLRLGWLHYQAREYPSAAQAYGQAAALHPTSLNALLGVPNAAAALQDMRATALAAAAVLRVEPTNYRALMVLGGLHSAQREYRSAAADYARVLVNYPDDPDALSGAAWAELRQADHAAARANFSLLLGLNPDYPKAREGYELATRMTR